MQIDNIHSEYANLIRTLQETYYVSITKTSRLIFCTEMIAVYSKNHTKHINVLVSRSQSCFMLQLSVHALMTVHVLWRCGLGVKYENFSEINNFYCNWNKRETETWQKNIKMCYILLNWLQYTYLYKRNICLNVDDETEVLNILLVFLDVFLVPEVSKKSITDFFKWRRIVWKIVTNFSAQTALPIFMEGILVQWRWR
jgi:hypothetical protein